MTTCRVPRRSGSVSSSLAAALSTTSGPLSGCTRPTNSSTTASGRDPELAPCLRPGPRAARLEDAQVRAGVDGLHLGRVRAVQVGQLACLLGRVGDQPVGGGDHLELAADPLAPARPRRPSRVPRSSPCPGCASTARAERPSAPWPPRRPCPTASSARAPGRTGPARTAASARSTSSVNWHTCAGRSCLSSSSNGPATTLRTSTPGASSASGGVSRQTARVKISTSVPRAASRLATWTT